MITDDAELKRAGFFWREQSSVRALVCEPLERHGFTNAFSTRLGGCSPMPQDALNLAGFNEDAAENIYENRRRFLKLLEGDWMLTACWQVHSADVRVVQDRDDARNDTEHCDALTTDRPNILLGIKTADCVPVLLGDMKKGAVAAVHAGWRGTLSSIITRTLERMSEKYGTSAQDVCAAIGPAAGACCYEVGGEVVQAFHERFNDADELFTPTQGGHARIDLQRANRNQLIAGGVPAEAIHIAPLCTMCRTDLFFSYRREKSVYGRTGRLLAVIGKQ